MGSPNALARLTRHHDPARWPPYDSFCRTTPHHLIEPGVAVGAHDQKINGIGLHIGLGHLSNRTIVDRYCCDSSLDSVLLEMVCKRCPRVVQIVLDHYRRSD